MIPFIFIIADSGIYRNYFTLPALDDLDNDGYTNLHESTSGSDPSDPNSSPTDLTVDLGADFSIYNDQTLTLDSNVSGAGTLTYQWTLVSGNPVTFTSPNAASSNVNYSPTMKTETYQFKLTISNGSSSDSDTITVTVLDRIDEAAKIGDPKLLPADVSKLEQRIQDVIANHQAELALLHQDIFANEAIKYDPTKYSRLFSFRSLTSAYTLITGNKGNTLASISQGDGQRRIAYGHNVLVQAYNGNLVSFKAQLKRSIDWLLEPFNFSADDGIKVAMMLLEESHMNKTENWLSDQYPNMTFARCNDENQLNSCLSDAHLIITGSSEGMSSDKISAALEQAKTQKQPLLYTHDKGWEVTSLTNQVLQYFGVQTEAHNFNIEDKAVWSSASQMSDGADVLTYTNALIERFNKNSFSFEIKDCTDGDENCQNIPAFSDEFITPADTIRAIIKDFDEINIDIFQDINSYDIEKLLVFLADQYRQSIDYPMDKGTTPTLTFLKAMLANKWVYTSRKYNPVPSDLGNFSRTDFSHITPTTKSINVISRKNFRAAGVYALPGQTFTITRTDDKTNVGVNVFINTQRSSSTQYMKPGNNYNRPIYLQSHHIPIAAGETITLTSPYGGPVQLEFSDKGTNLSFQFKNIGIHPYWEEGGNDAAFVNALHTNSYDWAEVTTEHFEIHSTRSKMLETLSEDIRWDTPSEMKYYITKYHHNKLRVLAGVEGEKIDVVDEIHNFATNKGFAIETWDKVQHFNADQQSCGNGCSGNPYDASWNFSVLGHGDLHEVGHTVESSRFKFDGFEQHAHTNFYSYYPKSIANDEDGVSYQCQDLSFSEYNQDLESGKDMTTVGYTDWNHGATLFIELLMHAEENKKLANGWHVIPRLHILQRNFEENDDNDAEWNAAKNSLGFDSFTRSEAKNLSKNDWLLIAVSYVTGLDYRPYFDMMGLSTTNKAKDQVASFAYPAVERVFYLPAGDRDYCDALTGHTKKYY